MTVRIHIPSRSSRSIPIALLAVSLLATIAASWLAHALVRSTDERRFTRAVHVSHDRIINRLDIYLTVLRAAKAVFIADHALDRDEFRVFVSELELARVYPGIQGVGFAQRVTAAEREAVTAEARKDFPHFHIWPDLAAGERYVVRFLEPQDARNSQAMGFDMFSEPVRRAAMQAAMRDAAPVMSGIVTLVQEIDEIKQPGFLIYLPVVADRGGPSEVEGFVYAPFRTDDLFRGIFGSEADPVIDFAVYDERVEPDRLLHQSAPVPEQTPFEDLESISVAGRTWIIHSWATPAFAFASATWLDRAIPLSGIVLSMLIFALALAQVRGQRELIESEAHTRAMVESAIDAVLTIDERDIITEWNRQAQAIFGWSRAEAIGKRLVDLIIPPAQREAHLQGMRKYLETGIGPILNKRIELMAMRRDGTQVPVELSISPSRVRGKLIFAGFLRDITERKLAREAEEQIRRRERQMKLITDALPALVSYIDSDQRYRFVNHAYLEWFDRDRSAIIGKRVEEVIGESAFAQLSHRLAAALAGERQHFEDTMAFKDVVRSVQIDYIPDFDEHAQVRGLVALVQDITARKAAELREHFLVEATTALNASLDLDKTLSDLARLAVPQLADWCIIDLVEGGTLRSVAIVHHDAARVPMIEDLRRRYPPRESHPLFQALDRQQPTVMATITDEILISVATDEEHLKLLRSLKLRSAILLPLRARTHAFGIVTLMTEGQRRLSDSDAAFAWEVAQRAAVAVENAQLYESERRARAFAAEQVEALARSNSELEQFAYVSSHDLKEPLRMVTQYMGLLQMRYAESLPEVAKRYISYASDGANRMQQLIDDLLAFSRSTRVEESDATVDAETVVRNVLRLLKTQIDSLHARVEVSPMPRVRMVESQLMQIFQNLIGNGLKFHTEAQPRIRVSAQAAEGEWIFAVEDNGIGIRPEHARRIFEVFQRLHTREEYPGTGIGLAICKKLVERHGGRIWVESEPGSGSTFYFSLPARLIEPVHAEH
jgi:PAS domain S-box-containing protein